MANRDKIRDEKERLMEEVLNKSKRESRSFSDDPITLSFDLKESTGNLADTMKNSNSTLNSLKEILEKQQKDLDELSTFNQYKPSRNSLSADEMNLEQMQKDLERDYGVKPEVKPVVPEDNAELFEAVRSEVDERIVIDSDTLRQLIVAFRRPFVMGNDNTERAKNVILVTGPKGTGRHTAISAIARSLYERQVFISDDVYTMDMSLYQSAAQEQVFLQDLYENLSGKGSVIVVENFESGFAPFLRMIDSLVCDGKVILNKRYVLNKDVLVENQTGLVKDAVDSFSASGKYFVFICAKGISSVQNAFGADFLYHVLDTVNFTALDEDRLDRVIDKHLNQLLTDAKTNLTMTVRYGEELKDWIVKHYDKTTGEESISEIFRNFYICLAQEVLENNLTSNIEADIVVENDKAVAVVGENRVELSRSKTSNEEIDAVNKELDGIIGLDEVKGYIRSLQSHIAMQQLRREQGMKTSEISKHMIFTGNPGTGKTTIARLISSYMKAIGALSNGQLVEVTRADLVAQYVGQTAPLTMNVIKSALGGVLFIDEAYSLHRGKDDAFGLECIDTIVKAMEDHRRDLIVILAGYKKEMEVFLESNSGLKSRFPNVINFPDYTGEELRKIAVLQAKGKGYFIAEDALMPLEEYFNEVQSINPMEAGNGRLARNVVEDAILKQSERLVSDPSGALEELRLEDFDLTVKVKPASDFDI